MSEFGTEFAAAADRIFGGSMKPSTPPPASPHTLATGSAPAAPAVPAAPASRAPAPAADDRPMEERFYTSAMHRDAETVIAKARAESLDPKEAATAATAAREWRDTFHKIGLNPSETAALAKVGVGHRSQPVEPEQVARWEGMAADALKSEFGPTNVARALADARALVQRHPEVARHLAQTGLGSHPDVVRAFARRARELRTAGRL